MRRIRFRENLMMSNTQKALLVVLAVSVLGGHFIAFLDGIHPRFFLLIFVVEFPLLVVSLIVSIWCLILSIRSFGRGKPYIGFTAIWLVLFGILRLGGVCSGMVGSLVALHLAGPEQVVAEGREMMASPEVVGELNRSEDYPPAIKRLHPDVIYVFSERTNIRKFGFGDFAGFVVYPEGEDPGIPTAVRFCRWLKIREGLYWFANG